MKGNLLLKQNFIFILSGKKRRRRKESRKNSDQRKYIHHPYTDDERYDQLPYIPLFFVG